MGSRVYIGRLARDVRERDVENFFKGYGRVSGINLKEGFGFVNFEEKRDADDAVFDLNGRQLCGERVIIEHAKAPNSNRRNEGGFQGGGFGDGRDVQRGNGRDFNEDRSEGRYRNAGGGGGGGGYRGDRGDRGGYRSNSGYRGGGGGYGGGSDSYRSYDNYRPRTQPFRTENKILVENIPGDMSWQDLKDLMKKAGEVTFADAHKIRKGEGIVEFASNSDVKRAIDKFDGYELEGRKLKVRDGSKRNERSRSRSRSRSYSRSESRSGSEERSRRRDRSEEGERSRKRDRSEDDERSRKRDRSDEGERSDEGGRSKKDREERDSEKGEGDSEKDEREKEESEKEDGGRDSESGEYPAEERKGDASDAH